MKRYRASSKGATGGLGALFVSFKELGLPVLEYVIAFAVIVAIAIPIISRIQRFLQEEAQKKLREEDDGPTDISAPNVEIIESVQTAESPVETINYEENASASSYNSRALLQVEEEEIEEPGSSTREINSVFEVDVDMPLSDFMPSNEVPLPDHQHLEYRAFRHVLMEEMLKKHYSQQQPPGLVVMNSICLNAPEDCKAYCEPVLVKKNKSVDYAHPLDFFLVKGEVEQSTDEKSVETRSASLRSIPNSLTDMLANLKNDGDPTATFKGNSKAPFEAVDRPKTAGSKLPMRQLSKLRKGYKSPLRTPKVEREEINACPETADDSSSDLTSGVDDRKKTPAKDEKKKEVPWLNSRPKSTFNSSGPASLIPPRKSSQVRKKTPVPSAKMAPIELADVQDSLRSSCQTVAYSRKSYTKTTPGSEPFKRTRKGQKAPNIADKEFSLRDLHEKTGLSTSNSCASSSKISRLTTTKKPTAKEAEEEAASKNNQRPKTATSALHKSSSTKTKLNDEFSEESLMMKLRGEKLSNVLKPPGYDSSLDRKDSTDSIVKRPPVSWNVTDKNAQVDNGADTTYNKQEGDEEYPPELPCTVSEATMQRNRTFKTCVEELKMALSQKSSVQSTAVSGRGSTESVISEAT